ncbi:hypothetical protein [Hydrobacter penzbergensis]|nr:hypothetical protein [Hydrobacter penzbergensis]
MPQPGQRVKPIHLKGQSEMPIPPSGRKNSSSNAITQNNNSVRARHH